MGPGLGEGSEWGGFHEGEAKKDPTIQQSSLIPAHSKTFISWPCGNNVTGSEAGSEEGLERDHSAFCSCKSTNHRADEYGGSSRVKREVEPKKDPRHSSEE